MRAGLIIPSSNRMVEEEMIHYYPTALTPHITRLRMTGPHRKPLSLLQAMIEEASASLNDAKCDIITLHCTVTSMSGGLDGEHDILSSLKRGGAAKTTTTATAIKAALDHLGAKKIALITPYDQHKTHEEIDFLQSCGFSVISAKGWDLKNSDDYCSTPPEVWHQRVLEARHDDADVYLLSCANIRALGIIAALEQKLQKTVITSNQVVIWNNLQHLNLKHERADVGSLFYGGFNSR
jgi:maleate cis-trans isomerase